MIYPFLVVHLMVLPNVTVAPLQFCKSSACALYRMPALMSHLLLGNTEEISDLINAGSKSGTQALLPSSGPYLFESILRCYFCVRMNAGDHLILTEKLDNILFELFCVKCASANLSQWLYVMRYNMSVSKFVLYGYSGSYPFSTCVQCSDRFHSKMHLPRCRQQRPDDDWALYTNS